MSAANTSGRAERGNSIEEIKREEKARKLAAFLCKQFIEVAENADEEMWLNSAAKADIREPSDKTRARVIELLREKIYHQCPKPKVTEMEIQR